MNILVGTRIGVYHSDIIKTFFDYFYDSEVDAELSHLLLIDSLDVRRELEDIDFKYPTIIREINNPSTDLLRSGKIYGQPWHHEISLQLHRLIRKVFLLSDADRCLFLDIDIMVKPNTIQQLIDYDKEIISGNFILPNSERSSAFKELIPNQKDGPVQHYQLGEIEGLTQVEGLGTSVLLVKKRVLKDIPFRISSELGGYPDVCFSIDADKENYDMYVAGDVEIGHLWKGDIYYPGDDIE